MYAFSFRFNGANLREQGVIFRGRRNRRMLSVLVQTAGQPLDLRGIHL
jgi:hypothetical protein